MIKLRKIIIHIEDDLYKNIEQSLIKNKADNFLYLYRAYRKDAKDAEIVHHLNLSNNSYYVLKSRLYDKIQNYLSGDVNISREEILKRLDAIPQMCFQEPREIAIPYLEKIESDLLKYDMHNELLTVYSTLKKINLYSEKYFHYSQLYNKHFAFSLSIEKSEEILGNFNKIIGQYNYSKSHKLLETLLFIQKEIIGQHDLNPSKQIEIIVSFIQIQLYLFCNISLTGNLTIEEVFEITKVRINELPESSTYKYWETPLNYLYFEYYLKIGQTQKAKVNYDLLNAKTQNILLYTGICNTSFFFTSKINFLQTTNCISEITDKSNNNVLFDINDTHSKVQYGIYTAMVNFYKGNLKEAATILNTLLNENTFKDYFHIITDIKLTLAYIYLQMNVYDLVENILKSIVRKIKAEKNDNYKNVLTLVKIFEYELKNNNKKTTSKQKDDFIIFLGRNKDNYAILKHLIFELSKKYS